MSMSSLAPIAAHAHGPSIIMQGTSPFSYQSPPFHSSSYNSKLETSFMRDFLCCDLMLKDLHHLLQHFEEFHAGQMPGPMRRQTPREGPMPDPKAAIAAKATAAVSDPARAQQQAQVNQGNNPPNPSNISTQSQRAHQYAQQTVYGFAPPPTPITEEDDAVGDMEMDNDFAASSTTQSHYNMQQPQMTHQSQFGRPANRVPPLDMNALNMGSMQQQHQGLRTSTPTTPVTAGRNGAFYQNNPTVSSVNTPTLIAHPSAHPLQNQVFSPEASAPGSPAAELDPEFVGNMSHMNVGNGIGFLHNTAWGNNNHGDGSQFLDLCIDEPAKRLWSANGEFADQSQPTKTTPAQSTSAQQLGDAQYSEDSELAKTIREQQKLAGVPDPSADGGPPKPFHCPVLGCEKAYKNHNGLKYHKGHGHNTQILRANDNGTFNIVDPTTMVAYPGNTGMEKHKPYRCDTCGKRYKNLNGLKYHKGHSSTCDQEIVLPHTNGNGNGAQSNTNVNGRAPAPATTNTAQNGGAGHPANGVMDAMNM